MQFPFNLNYYSKYNRAKDRKSIGSLLSLIPIGPFHNEQGCLLNLGKQKERFLASDGKNNIEKENKFSLKNSLEKEIIQRKCLQNEVVDASYYQQEGSQSKQQEQPINMPNHKSNLCHFQSQENQGLYQQSEGSSSIEQKFYDQPSGNAFTTKNQNKLILQAPGEIESFQQDFTQVQSVVLDRLLVFQGYHQYSLSIEDRDPQNSLQKIFRYQSSLKSQIPAIALTQQQSISRISRIQTQMNNQQQSPDIISQSNSFLHQDDFFEKQPSKNEVIVCKIEKGKKQSFLDSPLQDIVQSPVSMIVKVSEKRTNFKSILQRNKSNPYNEQFTKKKNKLLLAGFFEQN